MISSTSRILTLNKNYSTTRIVTCTPPIIEESPEATFKTVLFLPKGEGQQGVGGLRTQGYFKHSLPDKPLITIITVVFNGSAHLEETILSVINQTYDNVEYIIIDGHSTDSTLDIIRKYEHALDYWVSEKDNGIYEAMNKAVSASMGEYYIVLGCDDGLLKNGIKNSIAYLKSDESVQFKTQTIDLNGKIKGEIYGHSSSAVIKKELHNKFGLYDTSYKIAADTKFLKLLEKNKMLRKFDDRLGYFRLGGTSSIYKSTVIEHARAMKESGMWNGIQTFFWVAPRIAFITIKNFIKKVSKENDNQR